MARKMKDRQQQTPEMGSQAPASGTPMGRSMPPAEGAPMMPAGMGQPMPAVMGMADGMQQARQPIPMQRPVQSGRPEEVPIQDEQRMGAGEEKTIGEALGKRVGEDAIRKAEQLLRKYKAGKQMLENQIISSQEWWRLRNWSQINRTKGDKGADPAHSNTAWLWNCIVGKHADAIDSFPEPIILPRMEDDKEEAERLSSIIPVVLQINGFEQTYSDCAWQKMLEGTGAYGVFWDKDKLNGLGDITIRKVNMLNLFWEPGICDLQDSQNVFHVALMDNEVLEGMYPQLRGNLKDTKGISLQKYKYDDNVDTSNKSLVVDWYYHTYDGGKKLLQYVKFVGKTVLYASQDDPECAGRGYYDDGLFPFVLDPLFPVEGSPAGYGYIRVGKDSQRDIDLLNQAIVQNSAMSATPRYFVRADGGINEKEFSDWTKPFVHYNGTLDTTNLQQVAVNPVSSSAITALQQKIDELKFVTGNTDINNGGTPSGVTAASAIAALKEDSGRSSKDSTKAAYRAYAKIVTMVIERIRQFYDMPRQFRIIGARGQERFVQYSNEKLQLQAQGLNFGMDMGFRLPAFDIDVRAQRENAYTKVSQNELAIQMYQLGIFNPQAAEPALMMLDMMDFRGKDELQQKVQKNSTMQQMLVQYMQIALALAQQYDPVLAEQIAAQIQQSGNVLSPGMGGGAPVDPKEKATLAGGKTRQAGEMLPDGSKSTGNTMVDNARAKSANATRPD